MLILRPALKTDLNAIAALAEQLDSMNLPNDRAALSELLAQSEQSFAHPKLAKSERTYVFVAESLQQPGQLLGTSMIIAQHGTRKAPHIYLQVSEKEHYSETIDQHFKHQTLAIGYNYNGPTELGGLVVERSARQSPLKIGRQLSLVRFLFVAMYPELFQQSFIAELMPPLLEDGRSRLWEAYGKKFTGLNYPEADKLSRQSKEFIKQLFPTNEVYATLLDAEAQAVIGQVGPSSMPAKELLESLGFRYQNRIDPFDGGPHYEVEGKDLLPLQQARRLQLSDAHVQSWDGQPATELWLVGQGQGLNFKAAAAPGPLGDESALLGWHGQATAIPLKYQLPIPPPHLTPVT